MAQELNMRMPRRLPRAQVGARAISPDGRVVHRSVSPQRADSGATADGGTPPGSFKKKHGDAADAMDEAGVGSGRAALLDPITLAGQVDLEEEEEAEMRFGPGSDPASLAIAAYS